MQQPETEPLSLKDWSILLSQNPVLDPLLWKVCIYTIRYTKGALGMKGYRPRPSDNTKKNKRKNCNEFHLTAPHQGSCTWYWWDNLFSIQAYEWLNLFLQ